MFNRYYEVRKSFREQAEAGSTDPVVLALAKLELSAAAIKVKKETLHQFSYEDATEDALRAYNQVSRELDELEKKHVDEIQEEVLQALENSPDWIFRVDNRSVGEFFVRNRVEAVDGLLPFECTSRSERGQKTWRTERLKTIIGQLEPVMLGPQGVILHGVWRRP